MDLRDLHDAILRQVVVDWGSGTATLEMVCDERLAAPLPLHGAAQSRIADRLRDRSSRPDSTERVAPERFVLSAESTEADGELVVAVQMQSGDVIRLVCADLRLAEAADSP